MHQIKFSKSYFPLKDYPFVLKIINYGLTVEHSHDFIQILYMLKGCLSHTCRRRTEKLGKGDVVLIPPYWRHSMVSVDKNTQFALINFYQHFINPLFDHHYKLQATNEPDGAFLLPLIEMLKENRIKRIALDTKALEDIELSITEIQS